MSDAILGRTFNYIRNAAEDTLERVEKRWDQAMDVIHGRPIRHHDRDPDSDANGYATKEYREKAQVSMNAVLNALGGGEREAAEARDRLDYQLRHPGPGEIAERRADLMGDATVDKSQIDQMIRNEMDAAAGWRPNEHPEDPHYHERFWLHEPAAHAWAKEYAELISKQTNNHKQENGTMDREVNAAKQHVREREQERWNRIEQIGRQAIDSDRARITEKPTVTTEADLATKAERQRPQTA